nr:Chain A, CREB Binding Protein [synthetic construct]
FVSTCYLPKCAAAANVAAHITHCYK